MVLSGILGLDHFSAVYHRANVAVASGISVFSPKQRNVIYPGLLRNPLVRKDCNFNVESLQKIFHFDAKNPFNMHRINDNVFVQFGAE